MQKVEVNIVRLIKGFANNENYAVILKEKDGGRRVPIVIDFMQAHSIVVALEDMYPERPLTHDLFKPLFEQLGVKLVSVYIHNFAEGIFYAVLECEHNDKVFELDSRASDALALAVRFGTPPVYITDDILTNQGFEVEEVFEIEEEEFEEYEEEEENEAYASYSVNELENLMHLSIEEENYEQAAEIRDAINRKKASE